LRPHLLPSRGASTGPVTTSSGCSDQRVLHARLTIQDFERLFPEVNRRSLQRDLKAMVDMGLLVSSGSTNKLVYRMKETS
jgi:hypothetical protein